MKSTKYTVALALVALVMCTFASAARSADYVVTPQQSGANWIYSIQNNTASRYVVEYYLYWQNDIGSAGDNALADANFDETGGYIGFPTGWEEVTSYTNHPGFGAIGNSDRVAPGATKGGFEVHYIGSQLPGYAMITTVTSTGDDPQNAFVNVVPEPGSLVALFSGCVACFAAFRRRG